MENFNFNRSVDYSVSNTFEKYLAKTFMTMTLGLIVTALVGLFVQSNFAYFYGKPFFLVAILVQVFVAFFFSFRITKMSTITAWISFIAYCTVTGLTFSIIFLAFSIQTIGICFGITALVFGSMAVIGYTTNIDLTKYSTYLFFGLLGMIVVTLLNAFIFRSTGLDLLLMYGMIIIFLAFTAYDVQKIRSLYYSVSNDERLLKNFMVYGAFQLYLDFINLFIYILRLFGSRRD